MNVIAQTHRPWWSLYHGDCTEVTSALPDCSVDYSIFSPPFSSLYTYSNSIRDYGNTTGDVEFSAHFAFLVRELFRIVKPGRLVSVHCMALPTTKTREGYIGLRDFPALLTDAFIRAGFIFHSNCVIWKDPVTAMQRTKALGLLHKQLKKDSCMSRQGINDELLAFRKPGENAHPVVNTDVTFPVTEWQRIASPVWTDINATETLQYRSAREDDDEKHVCPIQLEVVRRGVRLYSNPGDVVFSPFAGIGSEPYVAVEMGRRGLGVELKRSYYELAVRNMMSVEPGAKLKQVSLFGDLPAAPPARMAPQKSDGVCSDCSESGPVGKCAICGGSVS